VFKKWLVFSDRRKLVAPTLLILDNWQVFFIKFNCFYQFSVKISGFTGVHFFPTADFPRTINSVKIGDSLESDFFSNYQFFSLKPTSCPSTTNIGLFYVDLTLS
jgi:hypothetical protein